MGAVAVVVGDVRRVRQEVPAVDVVGVPVAVVVRARHACWPRAALVQTRPANSGCDRSRPLSMTATIVDAEPVVVCHALAASMSTLLLGLSSPPLQRQSGVVRGGGIDVQGAVGLGVANRRESVSGASPPGRAARRWGSRAGPGRTGTARRPPPPPPARWPPASREWSPRGSRRAGSPPGSRAGPSRARRPPCSGGSGAPAIRAGTRAGARRAGRGMGGLLVEVKSKASSRGRARRRASPARAEGRRWR